MNISMDGLTAKKLEGAMMNECMVRGYAVDGRVGPPGSFEAVKSNGRVLVFIADETADNIVGRQVVLTAYFVARKSGSGAVVVVTNGTFDEDARESAEKFDVRLIDVNDLQKGDAFGENFSVDRIDDWSQHDQWTDVETWETY